MTTIIIGAVALGASTAARLKRLDPDQDIILLEKGNYASFANCGLPYFVGDEIKEQSDLLVVKPEVFTHRFQIDLRTNSEVIKIDPLANKVTVLDHNKRMEYDLSYDNLVLAMGADAIKPNIEGIDNENVFFLKTVDDAIALKNRIRTAKKVAVIGGGFIGLEAMENLVEAGKEVTLIEGKPSVSTLDYDMALIAHNVIKSHGVDLRVNTMVQGFSQTKDGLIVHTSTGDVLTDAIVMAIGVRPNVKIAKEAGIELDQNGTIKVNDYLQTNFPNIYAGGDLVSNYEAITGNLVYVALANYANKHGRIIANNIFGIKQTRQKITMASVFKLFNYTIASVGIGEVMAQKFNIKSQALWQNGFSHASYYPGATRVHAKIRFDDNGKILGGQFLGENLVEKRVDVLSSLLLKGCTYEDLMQVESTYAPPFNSAKDILNFFGFMIDNTLNGGLKSVGPTEIHELKDKVFLLDVRDEADYKIGHIPGSKNIPIDQLRDRLDELPKDQTIYVNCFVGITSYNAIAILRHYGFSCVNVSGGYTMYHLIYKEK